MRGRGGPWSVLGIEPTNDARLIRKAYAVKLRVTRPDEDPKGFQTLLEARDFALSMARNIAPDGDTGASIGALADVPSTPQQEEPKELPSLDRPLIEADRNDLGPRLEFSEAEVPAIEPDVEQLLQEMKSRGPDGDLAARWGRVFDALEHSSLENSWFLTSRMLDALVSDLQRDVPEIPDISAWGVEATPAEERVLGAYAGVLRDLEARFQFLNEDTKLLDYLDEEEARDLINALTIAAGRKNPAEIGVPDDQIPPVSRSFVNSAFGDDAGMMAYYERVRKTGRYPLSFSIFALFFPPFFALNYRLYPAALISGLAVVALIAILELDAPFVPLALGAHVIVAVSMTLRWRRMRLEALGRKVRHLIGKGDDAYAIQQKLHAWGQENILWRLAVLLLMLLVKFDAFRGIARVLSEPK